MHRAGKPTRALKKQHQKPSLTKSRKPTQRRSKPTTLSTPQRSLTTTTFNKPKQSITSLPLSTLTPKALATPVPSVFTDAARFAPTSKGWNKKSRVSQITNKHNKIVKERYHGVSAVQPFPKMTLAKFKHLPRPLFIESEVIDLFVPAPQLENAATKAALTIKEQVAQRPY